MPEPHHVPLPAGEDLRDRLFALGVEFPCGGDGQCGGCRIRIVEGDVPITPDMRSVLLPHEIDEGWRLGCQCSARGPVVVEIAQWQPAILSDETRLPAEVRPGYGLAVDVGTTTLVAQLVDLADGEVVAVESGLNPQARHGADIMSRVHFDLKHTGVLRGSIRSTVGRMAESLAGGRALEEVLICGNAVMHNLFCGISVEPLAAAPFRPGELGGRSFTAKDLGWGLDACGSITFLPCLGGFVGSDILAGIVAVDLLDSNAPAALMDLGTNGEIVMHANGVLLCASTAAGPAFEGGRISSGMRAGAGAVHQVRLEQGQLQCEILGGGEARGICGSGLVDAVAAALDAGLVLETGRLRAGLKSLELARRVSLDQRDLRELQLAKGAVAAGLRILEAQAGGPRLDTLYLAGAFGNYVRTRSAHRIGLLPDGVPVESAGNTALRGVRALLLSPSRRMGTIDRILDRCRHVELAADPHFQETFVDCLAFPEAA